MSIEKGAEAEREAEAFLKAKGFKILERNFRLRMGEIDLIARDADVVVFVEVRARSSNAFGTPQETVTMAKRRRIIRTAQAYVQRHALDAPMRFDVVARSHEGMLHIPDAFDTTGVL